MKNEDKAEITIPVRRQLDNFFFGTGSFNLCRWSWFVGGRKRFRNLHYEFSSLLVLYSDASGK